MTKAPLTGIKVLDVSSVLSGPLSAMLLADLGAEVIKVEPPSSPDVTRGIGDASAGMTAYFYNVNRGKRSLAVNGRDPRGRKILRAIADQSDVVVQNMRPGKAAGIGLDLIQFPRNVAQISEVPSQKIFLLGLAVGPGMLVLYLLFLIFLARYPMTRERHAQILAELEARHPEVPADR
jgi:hypothetical protein